MGRLQNVPETWITPKLIVHSRDLLYYKSLNNNTPGKLLFLTLQILGADLNSDPNNCCLPSEL